MNMSTPNLSLKSNVARLGRRNQSYEPNFGLNFNKDVVEIDKKNLYRITKSGLNNLNGIFNDVAKEPGTTYYDQQVNSKLALQKSADVFTKMNDNISDHIKTHSKPDAEEFKRATHASINLEKAERYYSGAENGSVTNLINNNETVKDVSNYISSNLKILSKKIAAFRDSINPNN